jgi:hypothetical protein
MAVPFQLLGELSGIPGGKDQVRPKLPLDVQVHGLRVGNHQPNFRRHQGEQIAANKVAGVRAALCNDLYTARLSRAHNDANVLSMGGRIVAFGLADEILALWLSEPFEGGRHQRRLDQIAAAERDGRR